MSRYKNFCEKLKNWKMNVTTSLQEFETTNQISFRCPSGHESSIAATSLNNKISPKNFAKLKSICADCNTILIKEAEAMELTQKLGFKFLSMETIGDRRLIKYQCVCGNESSTDLRNLKRPDRKAQCPRCQNDPHKLDYDVLKKNFETRNCVLLTSRENYQNNKQRLDFRCVCGATSTIVHQDLLRGRLCMSCKNDRSKSTSMETYGVDNPAKSEEIKQKIVDSMVKNHGVKYAQQKPEIRAKTDATSLEKYGKLRAFLLPEVFEKIRKTHKEKYGVEFPLQAQEIQDKITMTFMKTLNAPRPFLSEIYLQRMKEKYGHEWFCCTDAYKQVMLDKYGSENYITSDHCKQQMLDKYGSENYITSDHCKQQMLEKYGSENYITSDHCKQQMLEKYGSENYITSDHCKQQMLDKYGSENYITSDHCKQQMLDKYGSENYITSDHCKQQMLDKYGSDNYLTSDHCKQQMLNKYGSEYFVTSQKYREFMLETYGAESAMQCPELFRKAQSTSFHRKPYISPDGKTFMVLGYEGVALDEILKEEGIKTVYAGEDPEIPVFQYVGDDDKTHYYYPDIYIPEENRVIEIKSIYTYNQDPEKTLCKALKVSENHLFELRLYNHKKEIVEILECRNGMFYSKTLGLLQIGKQFDC